MAKNDKAGTAPVTDESITQKALGLESATTITTIKKADRSYQDGILSSNARESEDEFADLYLGKGKDAFVIEPPYDMKRLSQLAQENNALGQCIAAMEVNIDGTGFSIDKESMTAEQLKDDKDVSDMYDFFMEPYPGMSFITMRRLLRRDLEITGNAYIEVIRNAQDEIMFLRRIESMSMRLVKLGNAVPCKYKVKRNGKDVEVTMMLRVRKFAQFINGTLTYFKEFGAKADLDKTNGKFAEGGARFPAKQRATEIIHLTCVPDAKTPYGVPRWIAQAPSVIGSRKAEEHNIDFFDSGGIPPVVVFLMGGGLTSPVRKQLEGIFAGTNTKSRGAVVEVQPMSSGLDSTANSTVRVERFGAERQNDSMFEGYDDKCEKRIRSAFRLPPLFVGKSEDANYATAYASYTVAEAQVFQPERVEFDDTLNLKLMRALNPKCLFRSLPLNVRDIESQLKALGMLQLANVVAGEDLVDAVNEIANLNVKYTEAPAIAKDDMQDAVGERDDDEKSGGHNPAKIPAQESSPVGEQINDESNSKSPGKKVKKFAVSTGR